MKQKVLVTGATGFIGIEVSRQLTARGIHPRLMLRNPGAEISNHPPGHFRRPGRLHLFLLAAFESGSPANPN
jgi:nucleoside-diphosphate-sugar epimerase